MSKEEIDDFSIQLNNNAKSITHIKSSKKINKTMKTFQTSSKTTTICQPLSTNFSQILSPISGWPWGQCRQTKRIEKFDNIFIFHNVILLFSMCYILLNLGLKG